jgi:hypothetical protein
MPLNIVAPPYPVFTDRDGTPLENGYVFLGEPGKDPETNPINVFWDSALTVPAVQPIRTVYGYLSRNGTPAKLYANDTVSMTVKNVKQEVVFTSLTNLPFDPATSARVEVQDFTGDGVTTQFTLTAAPVSENNTQVFINGVYQNKDGYSLVGNVLTFSEAPPAAGSSIEVVSFETFTIGETDASFVTYQPAGTGAVQTTVQAKLRETVSVKDFGAVGDGVTDDTAAIQAAVTASAGKVIDGGNLTYLTTATITGVASNTVIQNATFDFSQQPNASGIDIGFSVSGTIGTGVALTSNTVVLSSVVTVASTSNFAADDLVFLSSSKVWDSLQGVVYGQYGRVKSVDSSTQISLYEPVQLAFNTADSAVIAKVTPVQNVAFINCKFIGANITQTQNGIYIQYGENCRVESCRFEYFDYSAVGFFRCYKSIADKVSVFGARNPGNAYGIGIWGGCYACSVVNGFGEDTRHYVTVGDNDGINMYTIVDGCQVMSSKDAGLDSHSAGMFTTFSNNMISMSSDRAGGSNHDGLIMQGAHSICIGNTVVGAKGVGISFNMLIGDGTPTTVKAIGNTVIMDDEGYLPPTTTSMNGIAVFSIVNYGPDDIEGIQIIGNSISGGQSALNGFLHIRVDIDKPNVSVKNVLIADNVSVNPADGPICYIELNGANSTAEKINIANNNFHASSADNGIYLYCLGTGTAMSEINIAGNIIDTLASGVRLLALNGTIDNARIGGNIYKNVTIPYNVTGSVTNINIDTDDAVFSPVTFTGSPVTINRGLYFIFNRGIAQAVNMPDPASYPGRVLNFKNIQAQAVDSASANVVPIDSATPGTAILPATDGAWAQLISDGTNWIIMQRGS